MFKPYVQADLPYDFGALQPAISAKIMELHYKKHHAAYVANLNKALEQYAAANDQQNLGQMIALQQAIKFNGGGNINHSIFWTNLMPISEGGGQLPEGSLKKAIEMEFGSLDQLKDQLSAKSVAIQGSGWGWLGFNAQKKRLEIATCDNQDPLSTKGLVPLLGIDVWEHAYYLQYENVRAEYVKSIWSIVNWYNVEERFLAAQIGS